LCQPSQKVAFRPGRVKAGRSAGEPRFPASTPEINIDSYCELLKQIALRGNED
jgi:hypothetical protein